MTKQEVLDAAKADRLEKANRWRLVWIGCRQADITFNERKNTEQVAEIQRQIDTVAGATDEELLEYHSGKKI